MTTGCVQRPVVMGSPRLRALRQDEQRCLTATICDNFAPIRQVDGTNGA